MNSEMPIPFASFSFSLIEGKRPRTALRMSATEGGMYELHVEKGSAANPSMQFTRVVPIEVAQRLKDALQQIGVFGWEESYDEGKPTGSRRWSVTTVFKKDVFTVSSRGSEVVPAGFDAMLEELYRLDFPRPTESGPAGGRPAGMGSAINAMGLGSMGLGGMSAADMSAYAASGKGSGFDLSELSKMFGDSALSGIQGEEISRLMAQMQGNPQAFQSRMRDEFNQMSRDEQERMLDMLASAGMQSRAWWERFFRG